MKKSELKNIIKECVKEVLFEEGLLSNIVSEVATGIAMAQQQILSESPSKDIQNMPLKKEQKNREEQSRKRLLETKRKMIEAMGSKSMKGAFEGTNPLPSESPATGSPLSNRDSRDPGVDISALFSLSGQKWRHLK